MRVVIPPTRFVSTAAAQEFRDKALAKLPRSPIGGVVEMYVTVYVPSLRSDGRNREKAMDDALKNRLFFDDCQIAEWHGRKVICREIVAPVFSEVIGRGGKKKRVMVKPGIYDPPLGVVLEVRAGDIADHPSFAEPLANSVITERANAAAQEQLFVEPTDGGARPASSPVKPSDARGAVPNAARPRAVLPEPLQQVFNRLAKPALISHREPDDEPPEHK